MRIRILLALMIGVLGWGLVACGDDSQESATGTATATVPQSPEDAYATALRDAASAVGDMGSAFVSGDGAETVAESIRSALTRWEAAVEQAAAAELNDASLIEQRDALAASSTDFVDAGTAVADEWSTGAANGVLELVQRRAAIAGGVTALTDAVDGALQAAGDAARQRLEGVRDQLDAALEEIQSQK